MAWVRSHCQGCRIWGGGEFLIKKPALNLRCPEPEATSVPAINNKHHSVPVLKITFPVLKIIRYPALNLRSPEPEPTTVPAIKQQAP
ncbi:hypothetical protein M8J76_015485 [Diaphorina citri]|nr:hypothetical protein M8J76_015485 [Diaphorina citri]